MEYIDGESLPEYLEDAYMFGDYGKPDNLFIQLIDGFQCIERQGIVHRDIREGNIMVDKNGIVKIIDFGLGKTFKPVDTTKDSMIDIINRSGLDLLPNEYFEGSYDSKTDMFYLAELFNRLLRTSKMAKHFSYQAILSKMMAADRNDRYSSFEEVKTAIGAKDFSALEISQEDKLVYRNFSNILLDCIASLKPDTEYVSDITDFSKRIRNLIRSNCFEDVIQNNNDLASVIIRQGFKYYPKKRYACSIVTSFSNWFDNLVPDSKQLVLNNIISKISALPVEVPEPELPF